MNRRRILTETIFNMRDLGGYETIDGKATRFGVMLRSEALVSLTAKDKKAVKETGVGTIIDLRSPREADKEKSSYIKSKDMEYYNVPLFDAFYSALDSVISGKEDVKVSKLYIELMTTNKTQISKIIKLIANAKGTVCFHCTAGKDRTGIIAAILLKIAGVPNEDIVVDYQLSSSYLEPKYKKIFTNPKFRDVPPNFFASNPENMKETLSYIDIKYKGIEAYLLTTGVSMSDMNKIREKFLENR